MNEIEADYKYKKTYPHYYKEVPKGVSHIDVYRVLELWNVSDPAIQHAIKKLLACGNRGYKDPTKDVNEAIVSLTRWIEMRKEESDKAFIPSQDPIDDRYDDMRNQLDSNN